MKMSLPGLGGIKGLLLAHGEKVMIAVIAALVLYMGVKSLGRETLSNDRQADDLQQAISQARSEVESFTWERAVSEFPDQVRTVRPLEQTGEKVVDPRWYFADNWQFGRNPAIVPPVIKRSDPLLLAAVDITAHGGSGLLAFVNDQIRRERMLEATRKEQQRVQEQEKQQQANAREEERGGNRRGRGEVPPGREGPIDPDHPNRRPAAGFAGQAMGVQEAGDEEVKVAYWATVVAKVPIKEQFKLYHDAFASSQGYIPQADYPQYLGYFVERAEVRPNVAAEDLNWEKISVYNGKGQLISPVVTFKALYGEGQNQLATGQKSGPPAVVDDWAGSGLPEVVDPRYIDPSGLLAFPLPPLVGRDFRYDATHPDIPLAVDAVELQTPDAVNDAAVAPAEEEIDPFSGGGVGIGGRQPGGMGGARSFGGPAGGRMGGRGMGGPGFSEYSGEGGPMGGGFTMGRGGDLRGGMEPQVPHWLLRFFDFSVQPGKKYKYRVKLVMLDPNQTFGSRLVRVDWLDSAARDRIRDEKAKRGGKATKTPVLMTSWSEPSRTVSIPLAGNVHVASARPAVSATDEPRAALLVESFSADEKGKAVQGAAKFDDFRRGYVANRKAEANVLVNVDGQPFVDKIKDFPFRTGITVVDVSGGDRLPGRDNQRPARVLLMDPAGQLFVQNELDGKQAVDRHELVFSEDPDAMRGGFGGRGGADGFGPQGFRGR